MQKPNKSLVAATFEKANTYVFAEPLVWDREVGGSNPLAPTNKPQPINNLETTLRKAGVFLWAICDQKFQHGTCSEL
jgi:hypothetical protein